MKQIRKAFAVMLALCMAISMMFSAVSVNAATKVKKPVTKITKNYSKTVCVGDNVIVYLNNIKGTKSSVKWTSSKPSVASIIEKDESRNFGSTCSYVVVNCKTPGTTRITAIDKGKKYSCSVRVKAPKLNYTKKTIKKGQKFVLKAINANILSDVSFDMTKENVVTFKVGSISPKTVNQVTVVGKQKGTSDIYVSVNGKRLVCKVTVK